MLRRPPVSPCGGPADGAAVTVLANARLDDGPTVDVAVVDGIVAAVGPASGGAGDVDLGGRLLCGAFVDGHIHLDKTLLGMPWQPHRPGETVAARIAAEKALLADIASPTVERARALVRRAIGHGTTRLRCHVDIDPQRRLANLHAILEVREAFAADIDIQVVAFPQSGILAAPGTADLLAQALAEGADLVGGLDPVGIDGDRDGHLDAVFGIAARRGVGIDIHLHDAGAVGAATLQDIAARSEAAGMQGRVAVSHAFALGDLDDALFGLTVDALVQGGVAIMTNGPGPVPMPPVRELARRGVLVFAGSDNIRDAWSPYGNGDMLERAMLIGYRGGLLSDEALRLAFALATEHAARATGVASHGVVPGAHADLVAIEAAHVPEAVVERPGNRWVFKRGRRVT